MHKYCIHTFFYHFLLRILRLFLEFLMYVCMIEVCSLNSLETGSDSGVYIWLSSIFTCNAYGVITMMGRCRYGWWSVGSMYQCYIDDYDVFICM
ncbi:hypothetical protein DFH27DRAFT_337219 [Peziza echinospora]|nr:hypothetical protein DFH27DRAFT_337219 [Peziza echinospora]